MTNENAILEKVQRLEEQLAPMIESSRKMEEIKADVTPLLNTAMGNVINELLQVEAGFELNDLFELIKQAMRSTKNLIYMMKQLDNIIEFVSDLEPLLKSAVPILIGYLDDLEKRGVLRILKATLDIRAKVAEAYDGDDMEQIGDGFVAMLGFAKILADPKVLDFVGKLLTVPGQVDLDNAKAVGPGGMLSAGFNKEIQNGFGVMLELTKALGKLKAA
jgi:uncharacterized protein YjgD (DUF1641 family)